MGIAQPAKVPLAHPQQLRRLYAAQLLRLMQPNRIDDPGHSDLRQHAIPPVKTGQIVCYETRTYLVSPTSSQSGGCASEPKEGGIARRGLVVTRSHAAETA